MKLPLYRSGSFDSLLMSFQANLALKDINFSNSGKMERYSLNFLNAPRLLNDAKSFIAAVLSPTN
jgi:hypothetical protein